jgi:hypothetical protein
MQGYAEIMKQSDRIRAMIEHNAGALEEVTRAHSSVKDSVADVDRTIKTILEVSRDLRQMTGSLGTAFSWFDEALRITDAARREEKGRGAELTLGRSEMLEPEGLPQRQSLLETHGLETPAAEAAADAEDAEEAEEIGELEPLEPEPASPPAPARGAAPAAEPAGVGKAAVVEAIEELEELQVLED